MTIFTIDVQDEAVQSALDRLAEKLDNVQPALKEIGDDIMQRTKDRFGMSPVGQAPDGTPWQANAPATLAAWLGSSKRYRKKSGELNAAGLRHLAAKRPLIGKSGDLSREFHVAAGPHDVVIGSTMVYAAIQQFGGKAGRGHRVTIPARPFLQIFSDGTLYPQERELIVAKVKDMLQD